MADTDTPASIPRRKAAQTASTAFADQLDLDSQTSGSETKHAELATVNQQPRKRGRPKGSKSRKATATKAASSTRSPPPQVHADESGLPPPPMATSKDLCADLHSEEIGIDGLSDLTSMSSDEQSSVSDIVVTVPNGTTVLPKPFPMSVAEHPTPMPEASSSKSSRSKASIPKPSQSISAPAPRRPKSSPNPQELDTYVWVLIAPDTENLYDRETEEEKGMWWPGKIQYPHTTSIPIEVKLFRKGTIYLLSPLENVLPQSAQLNNLKFKNPMYVSPDNVPRKKKQKGEQDGMMRNIWRAAVDEMKSDMNTSAGTVDQNVVYDLTTTDDEDLPRYVKPNPSFSKTSSIPSTSSKLPRISKGDVNRNWGKKRKRITDDFENSESDVPDSSFFRKQDSDGGEADISLAIPGELVLGRSKNQLNVYWPAKIEAYVRPSKPGLPGKYTVIFLDGTKEDIPRDWFYTMIEPQFALCKLGTFESKDPQLMKDNDDEDDVEEEEDRSSPVPQDPPPVKEDFLDLPIAQQFVFAKRILRAILEDSYAPSRQKHDDFVKGGKHRRNVTDGALLRGMMSAKDVERLHKIVLKWCLKNYNDYSPEPEPAAPDDIQRADQAIELADTVLADLEPVFDEPKKQDIIMQEPAIFSAPPEKVGVEGVVMDLTSNTRLTDYILPESAIRFTSRSPPASSPPPEMPPSSNPVSIIEFPSSQSDIPPTQSLSSPPASSIVPSIFAETSSFCDDADGDFSDLTPIEDPDEQTIAFSSASKRVFVPFKSLGHLVKVEYCSNVLVPEAIRQILLWRTGARTQVDLLSYEQEQLLYEKGQKLLAERDWVFDVIRLREQQLQQINLEHEKQGRKRNGARPKRNATTRNYVE